MIEVKDNGIILFENKKKQNNQPDWQGKAKFNGVEMDISIWIKEGKNGKFLSGQLKDAYKKNDTNEQTTKKDEEEILPF